MDVPKRKVVQLPDFSESPTSSVTTLARPKAKVNTSALNRNTAKSAVARNGTNSPTLRPASPTKMATKITATVSGSAQPKMKLSRPATSHSTLGTPNSYQHPTTHTLSRDSARLRRASMTFTQPLPLHDPPVASTSDTSLADCPPKIKSKISRVALQQEPIGLRNRTPSISSALSGPPEPTFYPITTATSAANPHRFAVRSPPTRNFYHTFSPPRSEVITSSIFATKEEDHQPPNSPPTSAVSISSRSSVSKSSLSHADSTTDSSIHPVLFERDVSSPTEVADATADGEHTVRAEAKSNRKIADLEITNKSLLAINASLEATKHRQAKEIRELRRKLRESRLILPPRAYRVVQSSPSGSDESDDSDDDEADEADEQCSTDDSYTRIQLLITDLLDSGRKALQSVPADFVQSMKGGAKVLTAEEVRDWRDSSGSPDTRPLSPAHIAVPGSDTDHSDHSDHLESEEEVESMISVLSSSPSAPSILVTKSP